MKVEILAGSSAMFSSESIKKRKRRGGFYWNWPRWDKSVRQPFSIVYGDPRTRDLTSQSDCFRLLPDWLRASGVQSKTLLVDISNQPLNQPTFLFRPARLHSLTLLCCKFNLPNVLSNGGKIIVTSLCKPFPHLKLRIGSGLADHYWRQPGVARCIDFFMDLGDLRIRCLVSHPEICTHHGRNDVSLPWTSLDSQWWVNSVYFCQTELCNIDEVVNVNGVRNWLSFLFLPPSRLRSSLRKRQAFGVKHYALAAK